VSILLKDSGYFKILAYKQVRYKYYIICICDTCYPKKIKIYFIYY